MRRSSGGCMQTGESCAFDMGGHALLCLPVTLASPLPGYVQLGRPARFERPCSLPVL